MSDTAPTHLTTRELADLLRIKERKVYDLAASGDVPCIRVVGKLLFPRAEVDAWMAASRSGPIAGDKDPPMILAGSHDPLLEWALRQSGSGLAAFFDGSLDGVSRVARRDAAACATHIREADGDWNVATVRQMLGDDPVVLIEFARRRCGLIVAPGNPHAIETITDLAPLRFIPRQMGAGGQKLFESLAQEAGLQTAALDVPADVGFGLAAMAAQYRLGFVPLANDRTDLLIWRRAFFEPPLQALVRFLRSGEFAARAAEMAGYDVSAAGTVHYNAP
jgi:excisionase family DNA binding protein